ncbi:MAG: hypothetical protein R2713_18460 [Ilumatobacteraceae bacterium]
MARRDRPPALVKAAFGGGGRGMKVVRSADEVQDAMDSAQRESKAFFGRDEIYIERYLTWPRHVEVQVVGDQHGNYVWVSTRDCSAQRRHQKLIEEAPSYGMAEGIEDRMGEAAIKAAKAVGYYNAGTVEFIYQDGDFFFLEMNTRLQVEHPVTEMITGLDLVELQLRVAEGEPLPVAAVDARRDGHAIEVRLCAEDPAHGYRPSSGTFHVVEFPAIEGVRVDSGIDSGTVVSPYYDSMVAKVIAHGPTRRVAARRIVQALTEATIVGPVTNREQLIHLASVLEAIDDVVDTSYLDRTPMAEQAPPAASVVAAAAVAVIERQVASRSVLVDVPAGWRNLPSQAVELRLGEHVVRYRFDRWGAIDEIEVDGEQVDAREARATSPGCVHRWCSASRCTSSADGWCSTWCRDSRPARRGGPGRVASSRRCPARCCGSWCSPVTRWCRVSRCSRWRR